VADNKKIVRRLFDEVLNDGRLELLDTLIHPGYIEHNPVPGQLPGSTGIKVKLTVMRQAFPDLFFTLEEIVGEGEVVAVRYYWEGTNTGVFMNIAPTGKKVTVKGMDFYRIKDGCIAEHWDSVDELSLMRQLGLVL
jgi:predicted ester cyclase